MSGLLESVEKAVVKQYRKRIARRLFQKLGKNISYGPFKGMQFASGSHLSQSDLALKATGLYEVEIRDWMLALGPLPLLINLGAGDGYYPIAMLKSGAVQKALAFEMKAEGRTAIAANAALNGVEHQVEIFGAAKAGLTQTLQSAAADANGAIFLCDIAEFDIIDDQLISYLALSFLVVELHPFAVENGAEKQRALQQRLSKTHDVEIIKATPRDWSNIPEIETMHDLERALVTTEGRKCLGTWLLAKPRNA
jgi:hypothetical protein